MKQSEKNKLSKERIIRAAIKDFNETGCQDIHISEICKNNGISKGLMYHYFESKEKLFYECLIYVIKSVCEYIDTFKPDGDLTIEQNLHRFYKERITYWRLNSDHYNMVKFAVTQYYSYYDQRSIDMKGFFVEAECRKTEELFALYNIKPELSVRDVMLMIYTMHINMFMNSINDIVCADKDGNKTLADEIMSELLNKNDKLINTLINGIKNND